MSDEFDDALEPLVARDVVTPEEAGRGRPAVRIPRLISRLYASADDSLRARLLACLLRPLGPLGLAAIAAGAFSSFLQRTGTSGLLVAVDDVARYSGDQIAELARFVEQVSPQALQQFAVLVAESPVGTAAFSAAASLLLLRWVGLSTSKKPGGPIEEFHAESARASHLSTKALSMR